MTQQDKDRIEELALIYAKMVEPVPSEDYVETARRLKTAIGDRTEKKVFRRAVEIIRGEAVVWKS